jgi:hypothetical protein
MTDDSEEAKTENLPSVATGNGFDDGDEAHDRLIRGTIIACVDGVWAARDGSSLPSLLIPLGTAQALQCWRDERLVEEIVKRPGQRLPDVDELNATIPEDEWEEGLDGKPRPPWVRQHVAYLLDPKDASVFTYLNSTAGAAIAVRELKDKVKMMRALRGANVVPVVELSAKAMKTKFGTKQRPHFKIIDWRELGGPRVAPASPPSAIAGPHAAAAIEHVGSPVKPVTVAEELDDEIPI